jgi:hypothetical protein
VSFVPSPFPGVQAGVEAGVSPGATVTVGAQILQGVGHGAMAQPLPPAPGPRHGAGRIRKPLLLVQQPGLPR